MAEIAQGPSTAKETKLSVPAAVAEPNGFFDSLSRYFSDPEKDSRQEFVQKMLEDKNSAEYKAVESFLKSKDPLSQVQGLKILLNISGATSGQYLDPNNQSIDEQTKSALVKFCKESVIPYLDIKKGSILTNDTALEAITDFDVQNVLCSKLKSIETDLGDQHPSPEKKLWKNIQQEKGGQKINEKVDLGEQILDERNPVSKALGSLHRPAPIEAKNS